MKLVNIVLSIPKTIFFNFCYLPFKQALKLPIWIAYDVKVSVAAGGVILPSKQNLAMIRICFHKVPVCNPNDRTVLDIEKGGVLVFKGMAHIGHGSKIHVANDGYLELGDNFAISASSQLNCYKRILFGKDIQFSWDCLVMDSDTHTIIGESGSVVNEAREIVFGDKVWIGCRTTILKGSHIPSHCVIGASSLVSGKHFESHTIIAGVPAKSVRRIKDWEL